MSAVSKLRLQPRWERAVFDSEDSEDAFISDQREKLLALGPEAETGQSLSFSCVVASSAGPLEPPVVD